MAGLMRYNRSRFELKYIISERCAQGVRDFTRQYLRPDKYALPESNYSYNVRSLYLDSPDFVLCRATMDGEFKRFKLRIRVYDDKCENPAFFEIKHRHDKAIIKERAICKRSSMTRLLSGHLPLITDLYYEDSDDFPSLQQFCALRSTVNASGSIVVSYNREAYVSEDGKHARVTFDRDLCAIETSEAHPLANGMRGMNPRPGGVILELKFTDRFPRWMTEMVEIFNLERTRMPKYVTCLQASRTPDFHVMNLSKRVHT